MRVRFLEVSSKLPQNQEGIRSFEDMVNSRIEEIEKEEGSGAINLYPLAKGDDGRTIRMRWTSRSDGGLGEFHFVAVLVFGYQSDEDRRVSDEDRRVFDGQCGGGYKPYGEVL